MRAFARRMLFSLATFAAPLCVLADKPSAESQNWPFLRGPQFDGHAPEVRLVEKWPAEGPPVLWTRPLGAGYSSFTVLGDRVYTQYQTLGGQYVICLDAETGSTEWEYRYEGPHDPAGLYPGPRATPTLGRGCVYFSAPSGLVGCLKAETGRRVWSLNVYDQFGVEPVDFGYSCSPVLIEDKLYLFVGQPDATLVALDADTGRLLWKSGNEAISHVPPLPITWNGRRLIVAYLRNVLMAFEEDTGKILWRKPLSTGYDEHAAWPIYREPYLWISAPFRAGSELLELTQQEPGYRTVWKSSLLSNDVCSSVLIGDSLYGFDLRDVQAKPHRPSRGQFRCLDFITGKERWANGSVNQRRGFDDEQNRGDLKDDSGNLPVGQASVLSVDGKLILFNDTGELILARANPGRYEELGRVRVLGGELCWTQPALSRGRLYLRNHSRAACIVLSDPDSAEHPVTGPTLTVADIPQSTYRDWAAWLLPVEPEYAMDAPTLSQLRRWFFVSLGGFGLAAAMTWPWLWLIRFRSKRKPPRSDGSRNPGEVPSAERPYVLPGWRWLFPLAVFVYGAFGTTLLSGRYEEFLFTWPMCLFVLFQVIVYQSRSRKRENGNPLAEWSWLALFLAGCFLYFWLCRRLSLAFEWVFLAGFPAAVPFLLLARRQTRAKWFPLLREGSLIVLAFAGFYWLSVGLLLWKYPT